VSNEPRLDEQAISKVAETVLSSQVDTAQKLDVDIRTDPGKVIQGEINSISIAGKDLLTQQNLSVQEMELHTDRIDIDLFGVLLGKIELNQPVNIKGRFVLTEADLNQNLNSDFIVSNLPSFQFNVDDRLVIINLQPPMELHLPSNNKVVFSSNVRVSEGVKTQQVRFTVEIYPRKNDSEVLMEKFSFEKGQAISLNILVAVMNKLKELINSPYLKFNGTAFRIKEMTVQNGSISLEVEAKIDRMP
jgi:LmeA-like phospholipid-binding